MRNIFVRLVAPSVLAGSAVVLLCVAAHGQETNSGALSRDGQLAQYKREAKRAADLSDFSAEMSFLQEASELGDASSMYDLGWIYFGANDIPGRHFQDYSKAAYWFQRSADLNYPPAVAQLGVMYGGEGSLGLPGDEIKASALFLRAAQMGDAAAMNNLGVRYMRGLGITKDLDRAIYWWRRAAASGGTAGKAAQTWLDLFDKNHGWSGG